MLDGDVQTNFPAWIPQVQCYRSTEVREFDEAQEDLKAKNKASASVPLPTDESSNDRAARLLKDAQSREKHNKDIFSARFKPYQLGDIIPITHDVALFRFLLHDTDDVFNLKPCSTLQGCYRYGVQPADQCQRFYTPITANGTKGYFDLIVKRKAEGKMTNHIFGLHVGDKMLFRAIGLKVQYRANRWDNVSMIAGGTGFTPMLQVIRHALDDGGMDKNADERGSRLKAASGATSESDAVEGLTADSGEESSRVSSSIRALMARRKKQKDQIDVKDKTKLFFLYCNRTEKHILLKGLFDDYAKRFPDRFKVSYCIDRAANPAKWKGYTGYVTKEMIREALPPSCAPDDDPSVPTIVSNPKTGATRKENNIILLCGPDQLLNYVAGTPMGAMHVMSAAMHQQPIAADANNLVNLGGLLNELGYDNSKVYRF